jgi:hypothetical protein
MRLCSVDETQYGWMVQESNPDAGEVFPVNQIGPEKRPVSRTKDT